MRVQIEPKAVKKTKSPKIPPVPFVKTLNKVRAGISQLNRSLAPASFTVLEMITGAWLAQAIHVAAALDIAGHLKFGPKSMEELADRTNSHQASLYRLLRMLAGHGIFHEEKDGGFSQTQLSDVLRLDHENSVQGMALYQGGFHWKHWEKLLYSVQTGKPAVDDIEETSFFKLLEKNHEYGKVFDKAMTNISNISQAAILKAYNFGQFKKIADIGGGRGRLLASILEANTHVNGILFDQEQVINTAATSSFIIPLGHRIETLAGNFFDTIPKGADCYLMKHIIHDWEEKKALKILENICKACPQGGKLILIESIVPEGNTSHLSKDTDLEMLVSVGGKERTRYEYAGLLAEAGFRLENIFPTVTPLSVLEATKI